MRLLKILGHEAIRLYGHIARNTGLIAEFGADPDYCRTHWHFADICFQGGSDEHDREVRLGNSLKASRLHTKQNPYYLKFRKVTQRTILEARNDPSESRETTDKSIPTCSATLRVDSTPGNDYS